MMRLDSLHRSPTASFLAGVLAVNILGIARAAGDPAAEPPTGRLSDAEIRKNIEDDPVEPVH